MRPMAVRLICFVYIASFLSFNFVLCQVQNHGDQTQQYQHHYAYGGSYAYKWEIPFTYTYTIPPFQVNANQYTSNTIMNQNQGQPQLVQHVIARPQQIDSSLQQIDRRTQPIDVRFETTSPSTIQQQQQPIGIQSRFGDVEPVRTTAKPHTTDQSILLISTSEQPQITGTSSKKAVRVPILDDKGRQIGWQYSMVDEQNTQYSFTSVPSLETSFQQTETVPQTGQSLQNSVTAQISQNSITGQVPQSTEPTQPVQSTQHFTTDISSSSSSYYPQVSNTEILLPPAPLPSQSPPEQYNINQIQQTGLSQQPVSANGQPNQPMSYYNSQFGHQTAAAGGGAAGTVNPSKICTAQQISSNLCSGVALTGAYPSVGGGANFFPGQQDIDRFLQSLQQNTLQMLSSIHQKAQFNPVYNSGDSVRPSVVTGAAVSGGPGGAIHSYTYTAA